MEPPHIYLHHGHKLILYVQFMYIWRSAIALTTPDERAFLKAISDLAYCNPFTPHRLECERLALGDHYVAGVTVWSSRPDDEGERENIRRLIERSEPIAERIRGKLNGGTKPPRGELELYKDLVLYILYDRYRLKLDEHVIKAEQSDANRSGRVTCYAAFAKEYAHYLSPAEGSTIQIDEPGHVFAMFYQIRRAFNHIFHCIIGGSMPSAKLRAEVWQSAFTHDLRRYQSTLYRKMGDVTTLVTGASGTGKELVARAIGLSRYKPFNPRTMTFNEDGPNAFHTLNLSALSPTLIESELFGHKRGAFTGALNDHVGWLETCGPKGTVFLDEIGELNPPIQVKLLRVLQERTYQSLGDTTTKHFTGKIIAATNRDLAKEVRAGRFREDFYYRLCSDMITTPTLHEQITDSPGELLNLILFLVKRMTGVQDAQGVADTVESWIGRNLSPGYRWPGNIRELEQCVWNILIRNEYHPLASSSTGANADDPLGAMMSAMGRIEISADELISTYCTLTYARLGSYEETARALKLDRRTVRKRIDRKLLGRLNT
jgi:DNA-binding NtrC family response regulator